MTRALVLYSGGLDSKLAARLLEEQGIKVIQVFFKLPFGGGQQPDDKNVRIIDCTKGKLFDEYLDIIRNPKHGVGAGINPCIDCRIFILKKAKALAKKFKCDFIATGEVLGQRPMSQTSGAMKIIDKEVKDVRRPLIEKGIKGRSRKPQIALAKKYKIKYPHPAGGCLLCEKDYAAKLRDLFKHEKEIKPEHIESLHGFRHFRVTGKLILGRDEQENLQLEKLNKKLKYNIIIPKKPGPTVLFEDKKDKKVAEYLVKAYSGKDLKQREKFEKFKI